MRLVDIDECNRELFYEQAGGKDSLIIVESAFDMVEALYSDRAKELYNWHDLRKNPNDLPTENGEYLVKAISRLDNTIFYDVYWYIEPNDFETVIKWKYIDDEE